MRIRRSTPSSFSPSPSSSPSLSSCSPSSSCFSSSPHSTISSHSLTSSSNSTSSSSFSLSPARRCEGLDLLVKAVYHVAGSVVGVPYIQRRIIRRRKPAVRFSSFVIGLAKEERENEDEDEGEVFDDNSQVQKKKQKRRSLAIPSKYQNSVLQSWKPSVRDRHRRGSSKIEV